MSDNIKTLCSSKVSPIKSTHSSADKTANVKMVKKWALLNLPPVFYLGRQMAGAVLTSPWYHETMGVRLRVSPSITSGAEDTVLPRLKIDWRTQKQTLPPPGFSCL